MKWSNLKNYTCPRCGKILTDNTANNNRHLCMNCHFTIGDEKFKQIVNNLYSQKENIKLVSDNEQALSEF